MRTIGRLVMLLLVSVPVEAAPFTYHFEGTLGGATLVRGTETFDLTGLAFSVTGELVDGTNLVSGPVGLFAATSKYDFGAFGSFTTLLGGDTYQELFDGGNLVAVGLMRYIPLFPASAGFWVNIAPIAAAGPGPVHIPSATILSTSESSPPAWIYANGADRLYLGGNIMQKMDISLVEAPEPASLFLMGLGAYMVRKRLRRQTPV